MKQTILITGPVKTRSGYGNHARDICTALIQLDKYDVKYSRHIATEACRRAKNSKDFILKVFLQQVF